MFDDVQNEVNSNSLLFLYFAVISIIESLDIDQFTIFTISLVEDNRGFHHTILTADINIKSIVIIEVVL